MKVCDYCGRENDDDVIQCRECGTQRFKNSPTEVPEIPPGSTALPPPKWEFRKLTLDEMKMDLVTLLTCQTIFEADMLVGQLGSVGIRAFIPDASLMQAMSWNVNAFGYVRVQVSPNDYEPAKAFLLELPEATEPDAAPNGGPAAPTGNPAGTEPHAEPSGSSV